MTLELTLQQEATEKLTVVVLDQLDHSIVGPGVRGREVVLAVVLGRRQVGSEVMDR